MAESSRSWIELEAISVTSGDVKEKLDFHLQLAKKCVEEVHGLLTQKFNNEQCGYLVSKLEVAVESASLFLEWSQVQPRGPYITMHIARQAKNLELLVALAKEIESFVQSCSKDTWMESALTLAHGAKHVSSLGFNLELCNIAFDCGQATPRSLTIDEVCKINKDEVEIVVKKASRDKDTLLKNVTFELNSSDSKDCSLAKHLVHQLVEVQSEPTSDDDNVLLRLFKWVVSGKKTKQLGRGSSATVHEVKWFGIPAAKKTFNGPANEDFFKEVEILSQLRHPNITSMFCCHMNKWSCSIIMELMDGDLRNMMLERQSERNNDAPPFTILEGVDLMLQVGEGVNYLHDKRIVHRDLKSSNILVKFVEVSGLGLGFVQAKVVDFGLSKTKEKSTYSVMTCNTGTQRWMAPEVINIIKGHEESFETSEKLEKHVFKVDIYSFAMVCFEILTGELPFISAPSSQRIKEMVLEGERPKIPDYCPQILKSLIEKCWSQIPSERPCISDICLQLKYIKYLLMTDSNSVDACESMVTNVVRTKMDCGPNEIFVVHQLHPQVGNISTSVRATLIFFHGFHKAPEEWRTTWMTRDNKLVWPQEWLPEDIGTEYLRVLFVSFGENTTMNNLQEMGKNLVNSLVLSHEWKLGESGEAIFLVGHSFGGVLIKNLVTEARHMVQNNRGQQEAQKCEKFLGRLAKIVFYTVPHAEFENYISESRRIVALRESSFLLSLEGDSQFVADMNKLSAEFENVIPEKLQILAFLEGKAMSKGCVLVTEKSFGRASNSWEWHKIDEDNHFEVCRPNSKNHTGYRILLQHLHQHLNDPYGVTSTLASGFTRVLGKRQSDDLSTASEAFHGKWLSSRGEGSSTSANVSVTPEHSTLSIIDSNTPNDFSRCASRWTVIDETKRREKGERENLSEGLQLLDVEVGEVSTPSSGDSSTDMLPGVFPKEPNWSTWAPCELFGSGTFGSVYEGVSSKRIFFTVKEVSLVDVGKAGKQAIRQLEQEIAVLSKIRHPNIVQYLGTVRDDEKLCIFLELVSSIGSLAHLYEKYEFFIDEVRLYTKQILLGLKFLHDRKIIHRDIKCENILVDASGTVKLAQFGMAKQTDKLGLLKAFLDGAHWMAPEVVNPRRSYNLKADIWSLGCTVLEMATGKPPYGEEIETHGVLWKVGNGEAPTIPEEFDEDLKDFIRSCLEVNVANRPTCDLLLTHPFITGEPVTGPVSECGKSTLLRLASGTSLQ